VQPARLKLLLFDPELLRDLRIVAAHLRHESLGVLAPDEHLELDAEREVGREGVVDDGVDDRRLAVHLRPTRVPGRAYLERGRHNASTRGAIDMHHLDPIT
jgi:hypothetical protein